MGDMLNNAVGDCFMWRDGLPIIKKRSKTARYVPLRAIDKIVTLPLKDLPTKTENMPHYAPPARAIEDYNKPDVCGNARACLAGFYMPADGAPPVGVTSHGSLLYFGDKRQPITNMSPLMMSPESVNASFTGLDITWIHAMVESLWAINAVKNNNCSHFFNSNPYRENKHIDLATSVLRTVFSDKVRKQFMTTVQETIARTQDVINTTFGLSHEGRAVAVKLWGVHIESPSAKDIVGYIPADNFSSFVATGSPLLSESELLRYLKNKYQEAHCRKESAARYR